MTLTPEQKKIVSEWVAAGDSLSTIQNKLRESFQVSLTYRDVRFLVDDLNLELKDADTFHFGEAWRQAGTATGMRD